MFHIGTSSNTSGTVGKAFLSGLSGLRRCSCWCFILMLLLIILFHMYLSHLPIPLREWVMIHSLPNMVVNKYIFKCLIKLTNWRIYCSSFGTCNTFHTWIEEPSPMKELEIYLPIKEWVLDCVILCASKTKEYLWGMTLKDLGQTLRGYFWIVLTPTNMNDFTKSHLDKISCPILKNDIALGTCPCFLLRFLWEHCSVLQYPPFEDSQETFLA